jgi:diguanylate cyclase
LEAPAPVSKILIVDDNPINRKLVATLLRHEGHEITEAADGAEGLLSAQRHRPQLIISDILMPEMDGYEFVRRLRASPELARTAVIFYTANYHQREAQALAEKCQVNRVVVKPCPAGELVRVVDSVLGTAEPQNAAPPDIEFDADHLRLLTNKLARTADELQASNEQLAALVDLNVQLASERDAQTLLSHVCQGARNLLGARFGVLAVKHRHEAREAFTAMSGLEIPEDAPPLQIDAGRLGGLLRTPVAFRLVASDAAVELGLPETYRAGSFVAAAVVSLTRTYGWICLADKLGAEEFNAEDERLLAIVGAQVGRIYENGSLYAEIQKYAAELLLEVDERARAIRELQASEQRFRQVAETIEDVFFLVDPRLARFLYVSPAYERLSGRRCQELMDRPHSWMRRLHPDDRAQAIEQQRRVASALPTPGQMEFRIRSPDGSVRWIQVRIFASCDEHGTVMRVVGVASDVTERNLAEAKVKHLNRVYGMLSGINSLIVRAEDKDVLLNETCRLAINAGMFGAAWCGLVDSTGEIRGVAMAGALPKDLSTQPVTGAQALANPIGDALRSKQPIICNELQGSLEDLSAALLANGYRSLVALPLIIAGNAVGCIVLVAREGGFFNDDEMRLLTEFAGDVSFALDHIDKGEQLNYLSYYDVLTSLPNRSLFLERLTQFVHVARLSVPQFAVIVADPERFAAFNDTLGRAATDQLLREVALRLAGCVGAHDLVGRTGPGQFAAVVTELSAAADVPKLVDGLWRDWLRTPFGLPQQPIRVTAKAGVAIYPTDGSDAETLLRNAETALKNAKNLARPFAAYTAKLSEELIARAALEKNLRQALDQEQFVLHYQPKVDLESRQLLGLEALIRWNSPELGLVSPAKFIPVLEENGLIVEVGAWVLHQATLDRARWLERRLSAPRVAVNVSTVQLRRDDFVRTLSNIVRIAGPEPGLDIEVTESLLITDVADNLAKLQAVRELGVKIALDDFGTGFCSLSYLARLPVHQLKIDRSFVSTMLDDPSTMTLVSTIISLARALKLEIVAEGVESDEQAKILRLLQCSQMQGYLVCKPLAFDEMTAYLSRRRVQ